MMGGNLGCISVVGGEECSLLVLHQMGCPENDLGGGEVVLGLLPASSQDSHNTEPTNQNFDISDPRNAEYGFGHQDWGEEGPDVPSGMQDFHQNPDDESPNNCSDFSNMFSSTESTGLAESLGNGSRATRSWVEGTCDGSNGVEGIDDGINVDSADIDFDFGFDQPNNFVFGNVPAANFLRADGSLECGDMGCKAALTPFDEFPRCVFLPTFLKSVNRN
jgi:hypothetical protein